MVAGGTGSQVKRGVFCFCAVVGCLGLWFPGMYGLMLWSLGLWPDAVTLYEERQE